MKRGWWHYVPHLVAVVGALLVVYYLRLVLAPFVIAYLLAALFDPLADRLEKRLHRHWAVLTIFAGFLLVFVVGLVEVVPLAVGEISQFVRHVPDYVEKAPALLETMRRHLGNLQVPAYLRDTLMLHVGKLSNAVAAQVGEWAQGAIQSVEFLLWLVIIPIATFSLLNDIDRVRAKALLLVPAAHRDTVQEIARDVASVFLSYLRGLITIAVLYGIVILAVLWGLKVPYALALGIMAGVLYPVPYLGPLITTIAILVVATVTLGWGVGIGAGAAALAANQVFDQVLSPRIVGRSVGLHPIWSMIAVLAGAKVFGLLGMIVAYPVAGAIQVILLRLVPGLRTAPAPAESSAGRSGDTRERR